MSDSTLSRSGAGRRSLSAGLVAGLGVMVAVGYGVYAHIERAHAVTATAEERARQVPDVRMLIFTEN